MAKTADHQLGQIAHALERGREERSEMRTDVKEIRDGFADLKLLIGEIRTTLINFNGRTEDLENHVAGQGGIKDRLFFVEAQVKDHEEVIKAVKKLIWRVGLGALAAAALSGGLGGRIADLFME